MFNSGFLLIHKPNKFLIHDSGLWHVNEVR